ncbi:MAG: hypothetical protein ABGX27_08505 [Desulfurobacteriaceae bacterium]
MKGIIKTVVLSTSITKVRSFGVCPKCGFYLKLVFSPFGKFIVCPRCDFWRKIN